MNAIPEFTGTLTFSVTGPGVSIDPATGAISIAAGKLQDGIEVAVSATAPDGTATGRYRLTIASPPRLMAAPVLSGPAVIDTPAEVDPGSWEAASSLALQWCRDGADIPGATAASYVPVAADDRTRLACRVTASNTAGSTAAETAAVEVIHAAPGVTGTLADLELELDSVAGVVEAAAAFTGAGLGYAVTGAGATIDPATGRVSIPTGALVAGAAVTVTASNSGGSASAPFKLSVRGVAPAVTAQPKLSGTGKVGATVSVDPGSWSGKPAPSLALQWCRDGADIAGATAASYVPVAADDRTELTCRVTASNTAGSTAAETAAVEVIHAAPGVTGTLADLELELDSVAGVVEAAAAFTGAGLGYAVTGAGATIDPATGRVSIPTGALVAGAAVTVTASNSGGSASAPFKLSVRGVVPAVTAQPKLSGTGKVGATVSVDPGSWSGKPAPSLALQWRRGGTAIAGATAASYVPVAADDRTELTCRVTATNAAGSLAATTAALAVTRVAPVASGTLADVTLVQGAAAGSVEAAPAFTGAGLGYAVTGAGATIDPATGKVSIPTAAVVSAASVTVTASNSGGSATVTFKVTVRAATDGENPARGVTVSSRQALLDAIVASGDGDTIKIAPGVYDRFLWPKNTSHRLTLAPARFDNPPIMRGIYLGGGGADWWPQGPNGWARNLTIDGLRFQAELLTSVRQSNGSSINIADADGRGYGWRADFSYPRVTNLGENAGFVGLGIKSGCQDIVVQNCLFEQYAKGINVGSSERITVHHNEFSEICEDGVIIWGGTDYSFQYNIWKNSRGVSLKAAQAYGWKNPEPVHQDFFQIACNSEGQNVTRLTISNNVMYDDSVRVHGVLLNNAYVGGSTEAALQGSRHRDVVVENNFLKQTHTTALQLTNVVGLVARCNKVMRSLTVADSDKNDVAIVIGAWGSLEAQNCDNVTVRDNVSRKYKGPWKDSWVWTGNVESNDESAMPSGWVEIRPERVSSGRRAGRYGQG